MKIELPPEVIVAGAKITEGGWESSNWFGYYLPQVNGWIFHEDLGWCFLVIKKIIIGYGWKNLDGFGRHPKFGHICIEMKPQVGFIFFKENLNPH